MKHSFGFDHLLKTIEKQENEASRFGLQWQGIDQLLDQIHSECHEVKEAWTSKDLTHLEEEIGDLLNAAVCLAVFCNLDPETVLQKSIQKFQSRFDLIVRLVHEDGLNDLQGQPFDVLMKYWNRCKSE